MRIFIDMKKALEQKIEIPKGVEVNIDGDEVSVKGSEGEIKKKFDLGKLNIKKENNEIVISNDKATKREKRMMNTIASHIRNMIKGVQEKFEYRLKACFSHFPINIKTEGKKVVIKNFLGEKVERKAEIPGGVDIEVKGQEIIIKSVNKELAGQAAANLEKATKIKGRDRRIFQDGIFMTNKAGKEI